MKSNKRLSVIVSILFAILIGGCATSPKTANFISSDSHSSEQYKAVVFGKVRFHTRDKLYGNRLFITLFRTNTKPSPTNMNFLSIAFNKPSESYSYVEIPFALEVVPGSYDLRSIGLSTGISNMPERFLFFPKGQYVDNDEKKGFHDTQHQISVGDGEMLYIGTIDIEIQEMRAAYGLGINFKDTGYNLKYTCRFKNNISDDVAVVKEAYPNIYDRYKDQIISHF